MVAPSKPLLEGSRKNLSALVELHDELAQGGGVIILGGPRGVGKALLLGELRKELAGRGRLVLFGRAELSATPELTLAVPYFEDDIHSLPGLLRLGEKIWR